MYRMLHLFFAFLFCICMYITRKETCENGANENIILLSYYLNIHGS